jgi:hypothetical protein
MNNKPVAWMQSKTTELLDGCECMQSVSFFKANDDDIPLYTHPVKELTDEEISQVYKEVSEPFGEKRLYEIHDFARAILRKAQEK